MFARRLIRCFLGLLLVVLTIGGGVLPAMTLAPDREEEEGQDRTEEVMAALKATPHRGRSLPPLPKVLKDIQHDHVIAHLVSTPRPKHSPNRRPAPRLLI